MGAANVKAAFVAGRSLDDQPVRLLMFMAVVTKDHDPTPTFYDGQDAMALALGEVLPGEAEAATDPEAARRRESALRKVRRALGPLVDAGLVECVERAAPGRRAVYSLHLLPRSADTHCPPSEQATADTHCPPLTPATPDTHCPPSPVHNPVDEAVDNPDGGHSLSGVEPGNGGHSLSTDGSVGGHSLSTTADTHCPPKDLDLKNKIKNRAGARTREHAREAAHGPAREAQLQEVLDEVIDAIATEQGWFRDHAAQSVTRVLNETPTSRRPMLERVRHAIARDPARYAPTPTPPVFARHLAPAGPAPCVCCFGDRYEVDDLNGDPRCSACATAGHPAPAQLTAATGPAAARAAIAGRKTARAS